MCVCVCVCMPLQVYVKLHGIELEELSEGWRGALDAAMVTRYTPTHTLVLVLTQSHKYLHRPKLPSSPTLPY